MDYRKAFQIAQSLNFQNVPKNILKIIAEHSFFNIQYCMRIGFKNVPEIIIKGISKNFYCCEDFANFTDLNNVPPKIRETLIKYSDEWVKIFRKEKLEKLLK